MRWGVPTKTNVFYSFQWKRFLFIIETNMIEIDRDAVLLFAVFSWKENGLSNIDIYEM